MLQLNTAKAPRIFRGGGSLGNRQEWGEHLFGEVGYLESQLLQWLGPEVLHTVIKSAYLCRQASSGKPTTPILISIPALKSVDGPTLSGQPQSLPRTSQAHSGLTTSSSCSRPLSLAFRQLLAPFIEVQEDLRSDLAWLSRIKIN